ncbi:MAG: hypothetical protein LQ338_006990 [Usnochroma carphineum]|nr:MAG: hypothetical protein LQ338_006990 [Usnochroma carphineum]
MPRLIRRQPLAQRIKAWLNPVDFLLWLFEEFDSSDWDQWQKDWSTTIGIALNIVFLIARANVGSRSQRQGDDVFGGDDSYTGFTPWLATFIVHILSLLSISNAVYAFCRRRHYRLFESSIDAMQSTPSAHRVRVDSSPLSSSPLRFFSSMLAADSAESRSHPDAARDVWELAVWDPTPFSLRLFCLLSPGHIFVYWLFLPTAITDPRPSTTVVTTIVLSALLSTQLMMLQLSFSQQSKDSTVVHKEVLNEYDSKFVHPRTRPLVRDVGTQYAAPGTSVSTCGMPDDSSTNMVETHPPSIIINRGFHTRPNPNYVKHVDPDALRATPSRGYLNDVNASTHTPIYSQHMSSPFKLTTAIRQPQFKPNGAMRASDGGNLGVFSHANSPLGKSASTEFGDGRFRHRSDNPAKREGSPLKRSCLAPGTSTGQRYAHNQSNATKKERERS